ncbi:MAG: DUF1573 domain-containing protein [Bacteroidia bacterium]
MKQLLFSIATSALLFSACGNSGEGKISTDVVSNSQSASEKADPASLPNIEFKNTEYNFGKITAGEVVTYSFEFTNNGGSDLIISNATASCGCTVPDYPRHPIKAGESAKIDVKFDSNGKSGIQDKMVTLTTNCEPSIKELHIKGDVTAKQ